MAVAKRYWRVRKTVSKAIAEGRREIDLVLEAADGRVVAVEIKATAAPTAEMGRAPEAKPGDVDSENVEP